MLIFGITLIVCYGVSATFHGVRLSGEPLHRLQRLDHVGIYLLIAGTYTPVAWALMRGSWSWGTLRRFGQSLSRVPSGSGTGV